MTECRPCDYKDRSKINIEIGPLYEEEHGITVKRTVIAGHSQIPSKSQLRTQRAGLK